MGRRRGRFDLDGCASLNLEVISFEPAVVNRCRVRDKQSECVRVEQMHAANRTRLFVWAFLGGC